MRYVPLSLLLALVALAGCGGSPSSTGGPTPMVAPAAITSALNHLHSIVILPNSPTTIYMGAHYRLYKSTDGGKTWRPLTKQMMLSMVLDPSHPSTLYAVSLQKGPVKSTDSGTSWTPIAGLPKGGITGITFDSATNTVFAYGNGVYRSTDAGAHWTESLKGQSIASVAANSSGALFAASGNGLYVSTTNGASWKLSSAVGNQPVIQIAAAGPDAYAVTAIGLMKSTDNGKKWSTLANAPAGIEFIGVAPSDPNEILAEIGGQGFMASYDGGKTWHRANAGIHDRNFNASTVRIAPSAPSVAYTGAWGLHFYATHDAGRRWTEVASLAH